MGKVKALPALSEHPQRQKTRFYYESGKTWHFLGKALYLHYYDYLLPACMRLLLVLSIFVWANVGYAQKFNPKIDSLETVLKTARDTNKVNTYMELIRLYAPSKPDKAIEYAKIAQKEAISIQFPKGEAQVLTALAVMNIRKGEMKEAFNLQNKALAIFKSIKDKKGIGISLNNIGRIYQEKSNYPTALEYFQNALKIREEIKDELGILICLNNIGAVYTNQANDNPNSKDLYEKSRKNYEKGLPIARKIKNKESEASLLNNIGGTYHNEKDYEKALDFYMRALDIYEKLQDKFRLISSYNSVGEVYLEKKDKDINKARNYQTKSLKMAEELKDKGGIGQAKQGFAAIYLEEKKYAEAIAELLPTLVIFGETGARDDLIKSKNLLAKCYEAMGNFKEAYLQHTEAASLKDSVFNMQNIKHLSDLQSSFELEKAQQAEKEANINAKAAKANEDRQRVINYAISTGLVLLFGLAFVLFRGQQREKKQKKEIEFQRQKSENLLLNILPEEVAEELKAEGKAKAKHYQMTSVLFTDFQGFTVRTATMTPEEVIEELNGCFSAFDAIIEKHNLEKIKTIGDAYMCAGGLPIPNTTNPVDIIRAGLEIQVYMQRYKEECIARGEAYFQCRLGINTGEVVAGVVGTKKFAYDIWGDTVNTASRAESSGVVNQVNITEATYELVKDVFECEYRGEIEAKGKGKIKMYLVLREKNQANISDKS